MFSTRFRFVRDMLNTEGLDAVLFVGLPTIRYLCGFTGSDGMLLVTRDEVLFLTDFRYQDQARLEVSADRKICYRSKFSAIVDELTSAGLTKIGFEADNLNYSAYAELSGQDDSLQWLPLGSQLRLLRACKQQSELESLKKAADLNRRAFEKVLPLIRPGTTERSIALELEFVLKRLGGECNAFDFIVASGERGALPHGVASGRQLQSGELLTIDFGTRVDGYYSDETVTLAVGPVDRKLRQIFDIVLKAHDLAMAACRPGILARDLDAVARDYIVSQGYGDYFGHGLGHGVGLEIHECPAVSPRGTILLQEGMVVTIEPGIYIPGTGGVRIEDTVVITANGCEALTSIPKQFYQLATE